MLETACRHLCSEGFLFFFEIEEFERLASEAERRAKAARILERFVRAGAEHENGCLRSSTRDRLLRAALMQFATHGIGAARAARAQAEHAFFTGDRKSYDWWIGVTRTLDRRIAAEVERRISVNELG